MKEEKFQSQSVDQLKARHQLEKAIDRITSVRKGEPRHPVLNKESYKLGKLYCPHLLDPEVVRDRLLSAAYAMEDPLPYERAYDEINRALDDGMAEMVRVEVKVSTFSSRTDSWPEALDLSWEALVQHLSQYEFRDEKDGPLFSPAEFKPGTKRIAANVLRVHFLGLDFDDIPDADFAAIRGRLAGIRCFTYATWSQCRSQAKGLNCYRVIVALSRAVSADEWPRFFELAAAKFGGKHDKSCKDAARMFYSPSMPIGSERFAHSVSQDGVSLDVDSILASPRAVEGIDDDPIHRYLENLRWDGISRIHSWVCDYLDGGDWEAHRTNGATWLIQAVNRVYNPGCTADHVFVLEGPQGVGKSAALQVLGGAWYGEVGGNLLNKDTAAMLVGKWIVELSTPMEKRREVEVVKAFISQRTDWYREPYAREAKEHPRTCVFAMSAGSNALLDDSAGARRFWKIPVGLPVGQIDLEALRRDRDQLWAEAVALMKAGAKPYLRPEMD